MQAWKQCVHRSEKIAPFRVNTLQQSAAATGTHDEHVEKTFAENCRIQDIKAAKQQENIKIKKKVTGFNEMHKSYTEPCNEPSRDLSKKPLKSIRVEEYAGLK